MKKILVWEPIRHSACSFYRADGVLMYAKDPALEFVSAGLPHRHIAQHDLYGFDGVYLGRGYDPQTHKMADWAHELGLAVISDYDDDLFNVEPDNDAYDAFAAAQSQRHVVDILKKSHLTMVTTEGLKAQYEKFANEVSVIPNAFNDHIFDVDKINNDLRNRIVLWRGGVSHRLEIAEYAPTIIKVMKENPSWRFIMMGYRDHHILRALGGQADYLPPKGLIEYFHFIRDIRPAVAVVPLRDSVFNASKSNIAWQEATWAGASTVLPTQYQWKDLPARIYNNTRDGFGEQLQGAIRDAENKVSDNFQKSLAELKENWLLSNINKKRIEIIKGVFK